MAPTMVAPARDTPDHGDALDEANAEIHRKGEPCRLVVARLQVQTVNPQQDEAADDERYAYDPYVEQIRLDDVVSERADHGRWQEREQNADDKARRGPLRKHLFGERPEPAKINCQQRENGTKLNQNSKRFAKGVIAPTEQVLHQQQVARRRDRQILGQALDDT